MISQPAKKRGRKLKENIQIIPEEPKPSVSIETATDSSEPIAKKRGRKPKGGKLIHKNVIETAHPTIVSNVILHLKCSLKDIAEYDVRKNEEIKDPMVYNPCVPPEIMTYDMNNCTGFSYYNTDKQDTSVDPEHSMPTIPENTLAYIDTLCKKCKSSLKCDTDDLDPQNARVDVETDKISIKDINMKLKKLRIQFYKNTLNDKKSACFWCSYEFDNHPCYIPKYEMDDTICGYGSFCRPECAVGFLMKENIDDSTKFERYQLLNQIYSKVYGYKKNIKPAPNPYYLLDKYYGTMTIQEYRKMLKTEHMLLVIDKPLTRILPELHEDNDEFILNIYGGVKSAQAAQSGGIYKVKRQSEKTQGPTKNSIMRDKFGLGN
jgi:hypothetical protein